jgi:hypothetical protein
MPGVKPPSLSTQVTQHRAARAHLANTNRLTGRRPLMRFPCIGATTSAQVHARPLFHMVPGTGAGHATVAFECKHLLIGLTSLTMIIVSSSGASVLF